MLRYFGKSRLDMEIPYTKFVMVGSKLHRILADRRLVPVKGTLNGRSIAIVDGEAYDAGAIAWALQYGIWPRYRIHYADNNSFNFSLDNMLPVMDVPRRCVVSKVYGDRYRHCLSRLTFLTPEAAKASWAAMYAQELNEKMPLVLQMQNDELERYADQLAPERWAADPLKPVLTRANRKSGGMPHGNRKDGVKRKRPTSRPAKVPGKKWSWYEEEWLLIPEPCHVADDKLLRCEAVKYHGAVEFYFDKETQTVKFRTQADLDRHHEASRAQAVHDVAR